MRQLFKPLVAMFIALIFGAGAFAQHARSKYVVTSDPIRVHAGPAGLCVAIDPSDATGVWWWGPGRSGCTSRDTVVGPGQENVQGIAALFHAIDAAVSTDPSGTVHARFRLGLHARPGQPEFVDINLTEKSDVIRCSSTHAAVQAKRLDILNIPLDLTR